MLTLINREFQDHVAYLVLGVLIAAGTVAAMLHSALWEMEEATAVLFVVVAVALFIIFCALGSAQMAGDRANRISSLLATLAVTRSGILTARVLVGLLTILLTLGPIIVTGIVLLHVLAAPLAFYWGVVLEVAATLFLTGVACYCVGLQMGWTGSKVLVLIGSLVLLSLVAPVLVIKGFGVEAIAVLLLWIAASLLRIWHTFRMVSL